MPNSPMTATRKLTPRSSGVEAEGHAQLARDGIHADRRRAAGRASCEMMVLCFSSRPSPTNEQKVSR